MKVIICTTMSLLSLLLRQVLAQNPCHSDCQPYMCHGPLNVHCTKCTGNREVVLSRCKCSLGWFDFNGSVCSAYAYDCVAGTVLANGTVACSECFHKV